MPPFVKSAALLVVLAYKQQPAAISNCQPEHLGKEAVPSLPWGTYHDLSSIGGMNGITLPLVLYQSKLPPAASKDDDNIKPQTLFSKAQEVACDEW